MGPFNEGFVDLKHDQSVTAKLKRSETNNFQAVDLRFKKFYPFLILLHHVLVALVYRMNLSVLLE